MTRELICILISYLHHADSPVGVPMQILTRSLIVANGTSNNGHLFILRMRENDSRISCTGLS
jgi:hypothetical protein